MNVERRTSNVERPTSEPTPSLGVRHSTFNVRRSLLVVLVLAGLGLATAAGWYVWRRLTAPEPPEVPVASDDPVLAEAVEAARGRVRQEPYSAASWGQLGKLLRGSGYKEQAEVCFAQAERLDPNEVRWPYLRGESRLPGDPDAALPHLRRAADLAGRSAADSVAPWLRLAEVLLEKRENEEAEKNFRRARDVDASDPSVYLGLGLLAEERGQLKESRRHLERARHSPLTQQRACARLAVVCGRLGDKEAAAQFSERAAALPPDSRWIDPYLAECLQLAVDKSNVFLRVEQLEAQGRAQDAALLLEQMVASTRSRGCPADARAYVGLGRNLIQRGDAQGAERALLSALRLAPDNVRAHYQLARLLYERAAQRRRQGGDPAELRQQFRAAADHARRAIAGKPDLAEAHLILGQALQEDGQTDEARRHLEQAVRLSKPGDTRAQEALSKLK
ncbi:MAG: tetratricopeptide repeat protein [Planctomycetes bacterium]|nr:tetratricopeptide repeat protein [Planctomycetota bacterium]